jgi:hypothetical protein
MVDAINLRTGALESVDFRTLATETGHPDLHLAVSVNADGEMRVPLSRMQELPSRSLCLTFENFITKSSFVPLVKKVLTTVQAAYGHPVDMEFAWDEEKLYILQCRALSIRRETKRVMIPGGTPEEDRLFVTTQGISNAAVENLEYIVYVDPRAYDKIPTVELKHKVGRAVGLLNYRLAGKRYALLGPGRWGSNDINLGVRVTYADINNTRLLVEIAFAREGYTPEVSYGTHFFQDLVEADIAMMPLYPDAPGSMLREDFLLASDNAVSKIDKSLRDLVEVIHVIHVPGAKPGNMLHVYLDEEKQEGIGIFGAPIEVG